jgi:alkylated DNA repair dioxygenase AlkB
VSLLHASAAAPSGIRHFAHGGWIRHVPGWLDPRESSELLGWLTANVVFEQGTLNLFGREVREPRLSAWFSDVPYRYSGRTLPVTAWPSEVQRVREQIESAAEQRFNGVLLNRYRDGSDGMGFHSDDEPELGRNPVVASLSLGAQRRFLVRAKRKSEAQECAEYELASGSLLIMGGSLQHHFRHAVPKRAGLTGERINLTFRQLHAAAA